MSASIILLCEDLQTESFVSRFLLHRNFRGRDVLTVPIPGGKQSGEQWVRTSYPDQLRAIRRRQKTVLLVVIDADTNTTSLREKAIESGMPPSPSYADINRPGDHRHTETKYRDLVSLPQTPDTGR